jgi:hypothetical protein
MEHPGLKATAVVVAVLVFVAVSIVASGGALIAAVLVGVGIYVFGVDLVAPSALAYRSTTHRQTQTDPQPERPVLRFLVISSSAGQSSANE